MNKCPKCNEIWNPCSACRAGDRHQSCVNDSICHECFMKEKWGGKTMEQIEYQVRCGQSLFSEFYTKWEAEKEIERLIHFFGYSRSELTIEKKEVS